MIRPVGWTATAGRPLCLMILGALVGGWLIFVAQGEPAEMGTRVKAPEGAYTNVTAPELKRMLEAKDFFFVNVHTPYQGEIAGTDASIPFDQVAQQQDRLPARKGAKIVLYCMSDRMSTIAAQTLAGLGYTNVWNLQDGMAGWGRQGYPLIKQPKK
jgi:rhodanese-related sulfurtransferase